MKAFRNKAGRLDTFVKLFNNEEVMKKHFPKTYAAYQNTLQGKCDTLSSERKEFYDVSVLHVGYGDEKKESIVVVLQADGKDEEGYCILEGTALNRHTKKILTPVADANFLGNEEITVIRIPLEGCDPRDVQLTAFLYTVDDQVLSYDWSENLSGYLLDYEAALELKAPIISHKNQENKNINIAYFWRGFGEDCLDYWYDYEAMRDGFVRIPSEGAIKVKGLDIKSIVSCTLSVTNALKNTFYYADPKIRITKDLDGSTISWQFDPCWDDVRVLDLLINVYEYVEYTLSISAVAGGKKVSFLLTNRNGANAMNLFPVDRIYIYRDCFLEGTFITMADGSRRKIEGLKLGDMVMAGSQGPAAVRNLTYLERMDSAAHIQLEDNTELFLTTNHPLKTREGFRCAFLLENGEKVETENGFRAIRQICAGPEQNCRLISVELEKGHQMYANGILAADSSVEAAETAKALNMRYKVNESWRRDYDGWQMKDGGMTNGKCGWQDLPG